jgi:hypothetical protein
MHGKYEAEVLTLRSRKTKTLLLRRMTDIDKDIPDTWAMAFRVPRHQSNQGIGMMRSIAMESFNRPVASRSSRYMRWRAVKKPETTGLQARMRSWRPRRDGNRWREVSELHRHHLAKGLMAGRTAWAEDRRQDAEASPCLPSFITSCNQLISGAGVPHHQSVP